MEALIGAIIGAAAALIGTWISTKHSTRAQMDAAVLSTRAQMDVATLSVLLPVRLDAYRQFEAALSDWCNSRTSESCNAVIQAGNKVTLIAGTETVSILAKVLDNVEKYETFENLFPDQQFKQDHLALLVEMNYDLMHIQTPKIEENKE